MSPVSLSFMCDALFVVTLLVPLHTCTHTQVISSRVSLPFTLLSAQGSSFFSSFKDKRPSSPSSLTTVEKEEEGS